MSSKIIYRIARIISDIFMPPFFAVLSFTFLTFISYHNFADGLLIFLLAISATVIIPIIIFIFQKRKGKLIDRDATLKEERNLPFVLVTIEIILFTFLFLYITPPKIFIYFLSVYITNGILVIIINTFYKISIHALNVTGTLALFSFYSLEITGILFVLLFFVGWSRYYLKKHTIPQIILGSLLGFFVSFLQIKFLLQTF